MNTEDFAPTLTEADWAWAAGFYEGEGSITYSFTNQRQTGMMRMQIGQKDREPLNRWLYVVRCGKINGPYERDARPIYYWQMGQRDEIARIYHKISPWLSQRRKGQFAEVFYKYGQYLLQKGSDWSIMEKTND